MSELPHRRFRVILTVNADDWKSAARELREMGDHVAEHGPQCSSCGGGGGASHTVQVIEDPEMTAERFSADLERWKRERDEERAR